MSNSTGIRRILIVMAVCGLGIFVGSTWHTAVAYPARVAATPTAVAVVDLNRLMEGLAEYQEITRRIVAEAEAANRSLEELKGRIDRLDQELDTLKDRKSEAWVNNRLEKAELESVGKARVEILRHKRDLAIGEAMRTIYGKVTDAVTRVGETDGWDLIMLDDRDLLPAPKEDRLVTGPDMNQYAVNRRVLYAGPRADITDQLITMMNNEFKAGRQ